MPTRVKRSSRGPRRGQKLQSASIAWIGELASPYLKGYRPVPVREAGLEGYWFVAGTPGDEKPKDPNRLSSRATNLQHGVGFFVGYLDDAAAEYRFLKPRPPECIIFAWVAPVDSHTYERLINRPGSLLRKTFEYIRWLTHRPPRFVFHEGQSAAMARHASMADWPPEKRQHLSGNFFIETLAWLVRSGLVRKLGEEAVPGPSDRSVR